MNENLESRQKKLFAKYLNDDCTQEELAELFNFLQKSDDREEYLEVLKDLWDRLSVVRPLKNSTADHIFQEIVGHSKTLSGKIEIPGPATRVLGYKTFPWRRIAAVFIGLLIVSVIAYWRLSVPDTITITTDFGQTREFWLPDSSKVILNGNSSLTYHKGWKAKTVATGHRETWLEGEAYFEVREVAGDNGLNSEYTGEKLKFVVHTHHLNVEVLGTAFNVDNHKLKTQVVLSSGKVKLNIHKENKAGAIMMSPGELVAFDANNNRVEQKVVNPELYSSWKDNQLIFKDRPVSEICKILEERYGLQVQLLEEEIGTRKFTGKVSTSQIDLLLKALASSFNLKVSRDGNQITMEYL